MILDITKSLHETIEAQQNSVLEIEKYSISKTMDVLKTQNKRMLRLRYQPRTILEYLQTIQPQELAVKYIKFYEDHPAFDTVCAGAKHHHHWEGGLKEHVLEMIGMGLDLKELYPGDLAHIPADDIIITCFLHDFAKIWQYRKITTIDREKNKRLLPSQTFTYIEGAFDLFNHETKTILELSRSGITPTDMQWSAVLFAEGGYAQANFDYEGIASQNRKIYHVNHLATFVSMLDLYSSQILGRSLI